jgi:hypothetical protein
MLTCDRERWGLREARAAWLVGVSVREYRELEAGDRDYDTWDRICKLYGWPQTFVGRPSAVRWLRRPHSDLSPAATRSPRYCSRYRDGRADDWADTMTGLL